ncbi:uncharacterized protein LOC124453596 [Xenia sp. Carnegie-2017]|uniref:uncharacterized protein LOC124453596 n=1 Tax=Xenia sp. Carnegie-2017 TaxID=2897299 RepID=UPI001F045F9A|nr:uncharacterized protein LOC124453596 [Xenia sp. Carnegie-2017]
MYIIRSCIHVSKMSDVERTRFMVILGWCLFSALFVVQSVIFAVLLKRYHNLPSLISCISLYFLALAVIVLMLFMLRKNEALYAEGDEEICYVWIVCNVYIVAYTVSVAMIFCKVAKNLTKDMTLGINTLKGTLSIAPMLLILMLQLTISPIYRKDVLSLSIFSALNIFDGIEMLEVILMHHEGLFPLNIHLERAIITFACMSFLISSLALFRNKFKTDGTVKKRERTSIIIGFIEMIGINLSFLILRSIVWHDYKYEASVFIAKNVISLVVGVVELCLLKKWIKWGVEDGFAENIDGFTENIEDGFFENMED